jgi:dipeptidase E
VKLLLTSNGLTNKSIKQALETLVGKPRSTIKIAFIPTAAFMEKLDDHEARDWLADDMERVKQFGSFFDVVSLADVTTSELIKRLSYVDVIFVGGGNPFYLSYWMEKSGLFAALPKLLESKVYAGLSAGSMIVTDSLGTAACAIKYPDYFKTKQFAKLGPKGRSAGKTAQLVDFVIRPHYTNKTFPHIKGDYLEALAKDIPLPIYALDDESALSVIDGQVAVISEGTWKRYN